MGGVLELDCIHYRWICLYCTVEYGWWTARLLDSTIFCGSSYEKEKERCFTKKVSTQNCVCTCLYKNGVDEQQITEHTGHQSVGGVRSYKRTTARQCTKVLVELGATRGQLQDNEKCQIWCWTVLQRNHSEATMRRRIGTQMITLWYLLWEKRMWVWIPSESCPFLSQLVFHPCRRVFPVHVTTTSVAEMWTLHYLQGLSVELKWNTDSNFILPCMAIYITEWYWFWSA